MNKKAPVAVSRIASLQICLKKYGLDAYIIPSGDPHSSEYVADHWKAREWITGFTGSAGTLTTTLTQSGLWTDSRYQLQAERELEGSGIQLHIVKQNSGAAYAEWLKKILAPGATVGCDGFLFSAGQMKTLQNSLSPSGIHLRNDLDLLDELWLDRPLLPAGKIMVLKEEYCGQSRCDKLQAVRQKMREARAGSHFLSSLDDIAWLLNLRGNDIENNPVFLAYLLIQEQDAILFANQNKFSAELKNQLLADRIYMKPYASIEFHLESLNPAHKILLNPAQTSSLLYGILPEEMRLNGPNPSTLLKAIKNPTEILCLNKTMIQDGVALAKSLVWLEKELKNRPVSEFEMSNTIHSYRQLNEGYWGESFAAIIGYNANAAIVHYRPRPAECSYIYPKGILLMDTGGQYHGGTTDITRTLTLGEPSPIQKRHFTLVLKGHIALATIQFPLGTTGKQLEILARMALWKEGLDFGHGVGHGVGYFLNVHEGPQAFSTGPNGNTVFEPGMVTSNEPGLYITGQYGIRIENLLLCRPVPVHTETLTTFLGFETLSLFPIDINLIDQPLLNEEEVQWLNDYHRNVLDKLEPYLQDEERDWLKNACRAI